MKRRCDRGYNAWPKLGCHLHAQTPACEPLTLSRSRTHIHAPSPPIAHRPHNTFTRARAIAGYTSKCSFQPPAIYPTRDRNYEYICICRLHPHPKKKKGYRWYACLRPRNKTSHPRSKSQDAPDSRKERTPGGSLLKRCVRKAGNVLGSPWISSRPRPRGALARATAMLIRSAAGERPLTGVSAPQPSPARVLYRLSRLPTGSPVDSSRRGVVSSRTFSQSNRFGEVVGRVRFPV